MTGRETMRNSNKAPWRIAASLALFAALVVPGSSRSQLDDVILFTAVVPPNVLLLLDNSGSMNNIMWHPAFDPTVTPTCTYFDNNRDYRVGSSENLGNGVVRKGTYSRCSNSRTVNEDTGTGSNPTRWNGRYLNWYFSDAADAYANDIANLTQTAVNQCVGNSTYKVYARARISALRQAMLDVVCEVNEGRGAEDGVRFGTAIFREEKNGENDVNGGFVNEGIEDNTPQHANDLEAHIGSIDAESWTPLGESLFQLYTYFMSRTDANRPFGADGSTRFPKYVYDTVNGDNDPSKDPGDPVEYRCQRNFIVIVTDGEPTKDDFDTDVDYTDEALGFANFNALIGDYNADGETETGGPSEGAYYLDDIAKYMHEHDFRPDLAGDQTFDIYTVGFTTTPAANALLEKTADVANGLFFYARNEQEIKAALSASLFDIIEKTQSFTASTVPASRTVDGADFYTSFFLPLGADPFWQGHLQSYHITGSGDIEDANGNCALPSFRMRSRSGTRARRFRSRTRGPCTRASSWARPPFRRAWRSTRRSPTGT